MDIKACIAEIESDDKDDDAYILHKLLELESENLEQIRDSLLPKLMSGKIRVPVKVENDNR